MRARGPHAASVPPGATGGDVGTCSGSEGEHMAELMHAMGFTIVENVQLRLRNWETLALPGG